VFGVVYGDVGDVVWVVDELDVGWGFICGVYDFFVIFVVDE